MALCSIIFGSSNYCQSNLKYHAWMTIFQKKKVFSRHSPKKCHCALNCHPTERYIIKDMNLWKKVFNSKFTCLQWGGVVCVCVCVWWWGGGDQYYVFTNGVAGIFAAMATNHMTRCIRLPQTECSEAWHEHAALHLWKSCHCLTLVFLAPPPPPIPPPKA